MKIRLQLVCLGLLALEGMAWCAQSTASRRAEWNRPFPPFRILGNLYYVGASGVSSFLITTPEGDILLDGGLAETAPLIQRNIVKLGFRIEDVRYLLNSHPHFDHCGGLWTLKKLSGAKVVISRPDKDTVENGHQLSYGKEQSQAWFPRLSVDETIGDGEAIHLGGVTMTAHLTPGHTKGATTWTMPLQAKGRTYQVVFYASTTVAGNDLVDNPKYPNIIEDYRHSFQVLRTLPCDLFLAPHPEFFDMQQKVEALHKGNALAFVVPGELRRFVNASQREFNQELAEQKAGRVSQ